MRNNRDANNGRLFGYAPLLNVCIPTRTRRLLCAGMGRGSAPLCVQKINDSMVRTERLLLPLPATVKVSRGTFAAGCSCTRVSGQ